MEFTEDKINDTLIKFTATASKEEFDKEFDSVVESYKTKIKVDGFRSGKIPNALVISRIGKKNIIDDTVDNLLQEKYNEYLNDNEIVTYQNPDIDIKNNPIDNLKPYLKAEIKQVVFPKFDQPKESSFTIEVDDIETLKKQELDNRLKSLQKQFASLKTVERTAKKGDFVTVNIKATDKKPAKKEDSILEDEQNKSIELDEKKIMMEGLYKELVGSKAKDKKKFDGKILAGINKDKEVKVEIEVLNVKEQILPKLDDDFALMASEFETFKELEDDLKNTIDKDSIYLQVSQARNKLLEELDKLEFSVPETMLQNYEQQTRMDIYQRSDPNNPKETLEMLERMKDDIEKAAKADAKREIFFITYARKNKITPTQEQVVNYIYNAALQTGYDPKKYADIIQENNSMPLILNTLTQSLAIDMYMAKVKIQDKNGKKIDLNKIGKEEK